MEQTERTVDDSRTEQMQMIRPQYMNGAGTLFGGQLALWIDEVAGVVAMRHCQGLVTTAAIDNLRFHQPVFEQDLIILKGKLTHVGSTSMEVRVDSFVERIDGTLFLINTAFVIMVALDENGKPKPVPKLRLRNDLEQREYDAGEKRRQLRHQLNHELYD